MATSGSKSITPAKHLTLTFSWARTSVSTANNSSTINWSLKLITDSYASISSTASKNWAVIINGSKYSGTNTIGINKGSTKTLASGTTTILHNNDGTKAFSFSFSQAFGINFNGSTIGTQSGSGSGVLDSIARQAIITAAPNFNDEENPTISYTNPLGNSVTKLEACISLTGSKDDIAYREISKTGTTYTFSLTEAERNVLRAATTTSKSRSIYFFIQTTYNNSTLRHSIEKKLTIINAEPIVTATAVDTKAESIALTGDSSKIIKGFNTISAKMTATAKKGATISSYIIAIENQIAATTSTATFQNVDKSDFQLLAEDSRGNSGIVRIHNTLINYVTLTCGLDTGIPSAEGEISLSISGNYFNESFGAVDNTLTVQYRYKADDGNYVDWISTTPTKSKNTYSVNVNVTGLNYQKAYTFQARAVDKVNTSGALSGEVKVKTSPVFDWSATDFNFNVPIYYKNSNKLFYEAGDSISFNTYSACWAGFITSGSKELYIEIPLSKPILASGAAVNGTIICRGNGKYIGGSSGLSIPNSAANKPTIIISDTGLRISLLFNSTIENATNNDAFVAVPNGTFTITFS